MVLKQTKKLAGIANNDIIAGTINCKYCLNSSFVAFSTGVKLFVFVARKIIIISFVKCQDINSRLFKFQINSS